MILLSLFCHQAACATDVNSVLQKMQTVSAHKLKALGPDVNGLSPTDRQVLLAQLIKMLQSPEWEYQANAAVIAGLLGADAQPAVPYLLAAMDTQMENVAWEVAPAIGKIGKGAVPNVAAELKRVNPASDDRKERKRAYHLISVVEQLGPNALELVPVLVAFLNDGANTGAVEALIKIGPQSAKPICQALEHSTDKRECVYACKVLNEFGEKSAAPLAVLIMSKSVEGARSAAYILSKIADSRYTACLPALLSALRSDDADVSKGAQEALIRIGTPAAIALKPLVRDDDIEVQRRVAYVLQKIAPEAGTVSGVLQPAVADSNPEKAAMAAATLLKIQAGNRNAISKLLSLLKSSESRTRSLSCHAIAKVGPHAAPLVPALIAALHDPNPQVRADAAESLGAIGPPASPATAALVEAATSTHPAIDYGHELMGMDSTIQQAAISALGKIGSGASAAVPTLAKMLADPKNSYRAGYILEALESMKDAAAPAVPVIISQLENNQIAKDKLLSVINSIGPKAVPAIPALQKIVADRRSIYRTQAFKTILSLEANNSKKRALIQLYLNDSDLRLKDAATVAFSQIPATVESSSASLATLLEGLKASQWNIKMNSIRALGNVGPPAAEALPKMLEASTGCSYANEEKTLCFEAIKKIDPDGSKCLALTKGVLNDPFRVRGTVELYEYIGSSKTRGVAAVTRARWKLK